MAVLPTAAEDCPLLDDTPAVPKRPAARRAPRPPRPTAKSASTREHLLATADQLIREVGLARFSTRLLAARAGMAEGTLYHHFQDKHELVTECVGQKALGFSTAVAELATKVGLGEVRTHLVELGLAALRFFDDAIVTMCAVLADSTALDAHRVFMKAAWKARGTGPEAESERIAAYLAAEQRLGRVHGQIEPLVVANLLIASMSSTAMKDAITGRIRSSEESAAHVAAVVRTLSFALAPEGAAR